MEFHSNKDMIFGKRLLIWGQKYERNENKNFIKIIGSAGSEVKTSIDNFEEIRTVKLMYPLHSYELHGNIGDSFNKKQRLIAEPECTSDCPDAKGRGGDAKHRHKMYGHTPSTKYNVDALELSAFCYLDVDRQKRMPEISLREIELSKEITSTKTN